MYGKPGLGFFWSWGSSLEILELGMLPSLRGTVLEKDCLGSFSIVRGRELRREDCPHACVLDNGRSSSPESGAICLERKGPLFRGGEKAPKEGGYVKLRDRLSSQ